MACGGPESTLRNDAPKALYCMWRTVSPTREEEALQQFQGKLAVLTGGGMGMGRELVRQLSADGCHVAMCDVSEDAMAETKALSEETAPRGTKITTTSRAR